MRKNKYSAFLEKMQTKYPIKFYELLLHYHECLLSYFLAKDVKISEKADDKNLRIIEIMIYKLIIYF